ncbi:MAG: chemotaxis protein CheA [Angelakisella sp.]|nr:chemotaxis protein CheA [Angelakisella sp.]
MSVFDPSIEPMLEMFIYETTTLLEQLDEIMLECEKNKSFDEDSINEIFRIMHTIKGSSAMMGLDGISSLAHAVEDVFYILREDASKLSIGGKVLFDNVFRASDFLKAEMDSISDDNYAPKKPSNIITALRNQAELMNSSVSSSSQIEKSSDTPSKVLSDNILGYKVKVFFEDGCQMENIRAFMLMTQLEQWCDTLESVPSHPENDSSVSNQIIKEGFLISFIPNSSLEDVLKVIENAVNVKSYEQILDVTEEKTQCAAISQSSVSSSDSAEPTSSFVNKPISKQSLISINQTKLDQLMDLVGEIVTTESMIISSPDLKGLVLENFSKSTRQLRKLTDELQDIVMSMRMVPLQGTFQKMNRIVRDMSKKLGKEVVLESYGGETEVDKTINDSLTDPFMHMIRNSMDHAIESIEERKALNKPETGKITIDARNVGGEIVITIADDGRGLNREKILKKARDNELLTRAENEYSDKEVFSMIMVAGFSTNEAVTEFSGRGVGMDVVRKNIEKVGGTISVDSTQNVGTVFTIKIPLTLAIVDGMELAVGDRIFTLPITDIKQCIKLSDIKEVVHDTDGTEMIMIRGVCCPVIHLHKLYNISTEITNLEDGILILIEDDNKSACLFADKLLGEHQVVVKPFPSILSKYGIKEQGLSGCTILGDGSISLILDAHGLLNANER